MLIIGPIRFISWLLLSGGIASLITYLFMKYGDLKGILKNTTDLDAGDLNFLSHIYRKKK